MHTYLTNKWGEILMLEQDGENFFGEAIFVHYIERSARICPG